MKARGGKRRYNKYSYIIENTPMYSRVYSNLLIPSCSRFSYCVYNMLIVVIHLKIGANHLNQSPTWYPLKFLILSSLPLYQLSIQDATSTRNDTWRHGDHSWGQWLLTGRVTVYVAMSAPRTWVFIQWTVVLSPTRSGFDLIQLRLLTTPSCTPRIRQKFLAFLLFPRSTWIHQSINPHIHTSSNLPLPAYL